MKALIYVFTFLFITASCAQEKTAILGETEFQKKINSEYKDASTSPLKEKDLKVFKGLDFYPVSDAFKVTAKFELTPNTKIFKMATSTDRTPEYRCYGKATFSLNGKEYTLEVYQSQAENRAEEYKDYLFLPFTDLTNGVETYGGGRYINFEIPKSKTIILDFNQAYNPYCAYVSGYSCPIVPKENHLETEVRAGILLKEK